MFLHTLIEEKIPTLKLFDKHGIQLSSETIVDEYIAVKHYLLANYCEKDIVALYLDKDYRYVLTLLACMSTGITYIPLNISWPKERIDQIKAHAKCHMIEEKTIDFNHSTSEIQKEYYTNEILYIIYTSGSTGMPKGVKIKRDGFENFLKWVDIYFTDITQNDRMILTTDFTFDISLVDISLLLTKSLSLYISNFNNNIFKLLYELETYKITTHSTVPYNYSMLLHENIYPKGDLSALKHIMLGGARFPYNVYQNLKNKLPDVDVYNFYGPTEATIYCAIHKFIYDETSEIHQQNVTIGQPFYNNDFKILDNELLISGKQLMQEYLHDNTKTAQALIEIDGIMYYKTGDVVFQNDNGFYFITGRKDDTIKVAGYRVNLSDIDAYLLQVPYINNAATIAIDNEESDNELVSYLILNDNAIETKTIRKDLKALMPEYQIAKYIRIVDTFPLNNSNKICKLTLKKQFTIHQ